MFAHLRTGRSIIGLARSSDGVHVTAGPAPFLTPQPVGLFREAEEYGVDDRRVTCIGGDYIVTYSACSRHGVRIALTKTRDFVEIERVLLITQIVPWSTGSPTCPT